MQVEAAIKSISAGGGSVPLPNNAFEAPEGQNWGLGATGINWGSAVASLFREGEATAFRRVG